MSWRTHGKAIAMGVAAIAVAIIAAYKDVRGDGISPSEWVTVIIVAVTAIDVWATANVPGFDKAKQFVAAALLVLNLLVSYIVGGITTDEMLFLIIQFAGALGVFAAPATKHVSTNTVVGR